ncbi:MAG: eL32 family ribosomal protein, partial [Fervidicoccaceae archaeon]
KGYPPIVKEGYRSARLIRGLHPSGLIPVVIANLKDAESLSPDKHVIYISSTVGLRKRVELERVLKERGFRIANERGVS